ncbi:MAG: phosphoribosylamine--glycine ligase [Patescibacteria group bacterium]|nr:phosphoribosylamine--glycine ligase [Patescibacteria group bacterium]
MKMKILIIGSGGREHALAWKVRQSKLVEKIYMAPGNAGTSQLGQNVDIKVNDLKGLLKFAINNKIDLTIVGPEVPLVLGVVDLFAKHNLTIFGPNRKAAQLEGSKIFAKKFMKRFDIPTAEFKVFKNKVKARKYLQSVKFPLVIKADGLAEGKGVVLVNNYHEAIKALGERVVIEECLVGEEVSVIALTDGKSIKVFLPAQDHKAIYNNDKGPNTGGMGAYAPAGVVDKKLMDEIVKRVFAPTFKGLKQMGIKYQGVLYAGLMLTKKGMKVLEFNCRFGDPETQPQMILLQTDLVQLIKAVIEGRLARQSLRFYTGASVCVVLASKGYPGSYKIGLPISGLGKNLTVFHAGTKLINKRVVTNGGRVLGVTSREKDLKTAIKTAYREVDKIMFKNKYFRTDIGKKGLIYG